jgi:hypothetical protein
MIEASLTEERRRRFPECRRESTLGRLPQMTIFAAKIQQRTPANLSWAA